MALRKNDIVEIEITGYTAQGSGVGRTEDGMAVFVPLAAKGDLLSARLVKLEKKFAFGIIEELSRPSPDRTDPGCAQFSQCGGCVFRHITYAAELEAKALRVRDAVERLGGFHDIEFADILGADSPDRYRNKAQLPIGPEAGGGVALGFYAAHSHRIVACEDCRLQPRVFTAVVTAFKAWAKQYDETAYNELTSKGRLRHLYLREAPATGELMACVVVNGNGLHHEAELAEALQAAAPGLKAVIINSNREKTNVVLGAKNRTSWGANHITDKLCGLNFRISPSSFYQVNHDQAERMYAVAREYAALTGGEALLDLYCGTGTIGLSMASRAKIVIGVELIEAAVKDARENAAANGITNAEFFCADASQAAELLKARGISPEVVVLDPPRKGLAPGLAEVVAGLAPSRVVYCSCDPATLARDLALFAALGYAPKRLTPIDLFPRTAHVESVCLLERESFI